MTCLRNLVEVECCTTLYTLVFENGLVYGQGAFTQIEHFFLLGTICMILVDKDTETKVSGNKRITRKRGIKV